MDKTPKCESCGYAIAAQVPEWAVRALEMSQFQLSYIQRCQREMELAMKLRHALWLKGDGDEGDGDA